MPRTVHFDRDITKDLTPHDPVRIGLIGAGQFARGTLLPALKGVHGVVLRGVATSTGASGEHIAHKHGLAYCTSDVEVLLNDPEIDLVLILTRHGSHASLASRALATGKHVFVEKPLALNEEQLQQVWRAYRDSPGQLMVGFNRRYAPTVCFVVERLSRVPRPLVVTVRVNVGHIPREVWVHDPKEGGGNLVGEVGHFVDLIQALTGSLPVRVYAHAVRAESESVIVDDNVTVILSMADGSLGTIVYTALGDRAHERERIEVFGGGAACAIQNFRMATWSQAGRAKRMGNGFSVVDRGHRAELQALIAALRNGRCFPVPFEQYLATTRATFAALRALSEGRPVSLDEIEPAVGQA